MKYETPSTRAVFCFVIMFKQVYGRPGLWLIDAINFFSLKLPSAFERNHTGIVVFKNVSIFLANLSTNMAAVASDCLMYFRLLLWDCCMDFNKTLQEASTYKMYNVPQSICISFGTA